MYKVAYEIVGSVGRSFKEFANIKDAQKWKSELEEAREKWGFFFRMAPTIVEEQNDEKKPTTKKKSAKTTSKSTTKKKSSKKS